MAGKVDRNPGLPPGGDGEAVSFEAAVAAATGSGEEEPTFILVQGQSGTVYVSKRTHGTYFGAETDVLLASLFREVNV